MKNIIQASLILRKTKYSEGLTLDNKVIKTIISNYIILKVLMSFQFYQWKYSALMSSS
ncbi:MAG: hypothetical protein IPL16_19700 [Ignavibacteria bacterium]|nr:hypothetical protein [Ignavibacteria bacterium]